MATTCFLSVSHSLIRSLSHWWINRQGLFWGFFLPLLCNVCPDASEKDWAESLPVSKLLPPAIVIWILLFSPSNVIISAHKRKLRVSDCGYTHSDSLFSATLNKVHTDTHTHTDWHCYCMNRFSFQWWVLALFTATEKKTHTHINIKHTDWHAHPHMQRDTLTHLEWQHGFAWRCVCDFEGCVVILLELWPTEHMRNVLLCIQGWVGYFVYIILMDNVNMLMAILLNVFILPYFVSFLIELVLI